MLSAATASAQDVVLMNGTIIDGTLKARFQGNIRIRDGKIAEIGPFKASANELVVDVQGMIVSPGFIDLDSHSSTALAKDRAAASQVQQGITTAVLGADGAGPYLVEAFVSPFDADPPAMNVLTFVGHDTVRRQIMGSDYKRPATPSEVELMAELVANGMREGAFGLATNLSVDSTYYSTAAEVIALAKVAAKYGGTCVIHLRNEGDGFMVSLREAIQIGKTAKLPIHVSHVKFSSLSPVERSGQILAELDKARTQGVDIATDVDPYAEWTGDISSFAPNRKYEDAEAINKAIAAAGGSQNVIIRSYAKDPTYELKTLDEIARMRNITPFDLLAEMAREGGASVMCATTTEKELRALYQHPWVMIASDGGLEIKHPRSAGTFPRVLGKFVRDDKVMTLERAVRKMTGLPALRLGLKERGVLKKDAPADIVVFDPTTVRDNFTLNEPFKAPDGIKYVFVNGVMVINSGVPTPERPGLALR